MREQTEVQAGPLRRRELPVQLRTVEEVGDGEGPRSPPRQRAGRLRGRTVASSSTGLRCGGREEQVRKGLHCSGVHLELIAK